MRRILVAEDDSALRLLFRLWLVRDRCFVIDVPDGRAAIEALERGPLPDAAVLDVDLPFVDGLSVCRYLHARAPSVPVVIASALEDVGPAARAAGASVVLVKPCTRGELLAALDHVLSPVLRAAS